MSTARYIIRFFLNPTEPGDRLFRTSILLHWAIGLIPFSNTAEWSLPGRVMAMVLILIMSSIAAVFVSLTAQSFWRWRIKRRLHVQYSQDQGGTFSFVEYNKREVMVIEREREFEVASAGSVARQLLYLLPGIPIGWLLLLLWSFIHGNSRYE